MSHEYIRSETVGGVARITFNRPDVLNSFHTAMSVEVRAALLAAGADDEVRTVLLTGAGRAFCAGVDLDALAAQRDGKRPAKGPRLG